MELSTGILPVCMSLCPAFLLMLQNKKNISNISVAFHSISVSDEPTQKIVHLALLQYDYNDVNYKNTAS